jgi:NTP pyrophosphatase (non-canonical NTP hydrolase)
MDQEIFGLGCKPHEIPGEVCDLLPRDVELVRMVIPTIQRAVHLNSVKHGFWVGMSQRNPLVKLMLVNCELAEAVESIRKDKANEPCDKSGLEHITALEEEIADAVIRLLDFAEAYELNLARAIIDKHEYNRTRPFKHGKTC